MAKILSVAGNDEWKSKLDQITLAGKHKVTWAADESDLYDQLQKAETAIVLLPLSNSYNVYSLCAKVTQVFPQTAALLVFRLEEELDMKKALRAGASDIIFLSSALSKIKEDIDIAMEDSANKEANRPNAPVKNGKVITIASTKGGVGKTTVAVNLAVAYGKKLAKVAIVDLDLQFGDVAMLCDVKPRKTIYDWVKENREAAQMEGFLTAFKDGISILAAPQRPEFAEVIKGNDVRKAIHLLKKQYDLIIIDASSHMDENVIVALENSDEILLMTHLDLPSLKNSKILMDTLTALKVDGRTKVVVNRQTKVKGLNTDMVEKVIGEKVFTSLPAMEKVMVTSVNEGNPLGYSNPRSQVAKQIFQMAEMLSNPINHGTKVKNRKKAKRMAHAGGHT
ncbi:hypothetical protein CFK37_06485 [Virgibacillus phasianinus]|uniref:AAA domain-containing protein n=1 Tax=Virgibacillus phasianinus TaxID=2017483 RepID=A0A220U166_9BACI|nr:AAA family ATPase [Virgibacillus phasianinus]ASK61829.1 hypothetical protein CFK37_06485 [Virgibacillus phasianinus]